MAKQTPDSYITLDVLSDRIFEMLAGGFRYLFAMASRQGHWNETRCTALAALCLHMREEAGSRWLVAVGDWILRRQTVDGAASGSWGEEIWDTAMCVLALKELGFSSRDPSVENATTWMAGLFSMNRRGNWHDEPWETSWALLAILRTGRVPTGVDIDSAVRWLVTMQSSDGRIVAPHYTAYIVLIDHYSRKVDLEPATRKLLADTRTMAASFLVKQIISGAADLLWTGEAWANGQILWALAETGEIPCGDSAILNKIVGWFERNQTDNGNWSDVEDTASAMLGLFALLKAIHRSERSGLFPKQIESELEMELRRRVSVPRLSIRKPLFQREDETGYYVINLKQTATKLALAVISFILVALLGWIANVIQIVEGLRNG